MRPLCGVYGGLDIATSMKKMCVGARFILQILWVDFWEHSSPHDRCWWNSSLFSHTFSPAIFLHLPLIPFDLYVEWFFCTTKYHFKASYIILPLVPIFWALQNLVLILSEWLHSILFLFWKVIVLIEVLTTDSSPSNTNVPSVTNEN